MFHSQGTKLLHIAINVHLFELIVNFIVWFLNFPKFHCFLSRSRTPGARDTREGRNCVSTASKKSKGQPHQSRKNRI